MSFDKHWVASYLQLKYSLDKQRWMSIIHGDIIDNCHNIASDFDLYEKFFIVCV